ncbi:MAG TPA: hypothetical protein ACFYD1_06625 [Candidatus Hypogeohydataceae bacterium YC38]
MYSSLYILFSVSLLFITTPPLSASDGRQGTTLGQPTNPPQMGWAATYGGGDDDYANSIQQTSDGGYILAGRTDSYRTSLFSYGEGDLLVLKLRADGTVDWHRAYGGINVDGADFIQQTRDGGYIVVGGTSSFGVEGSDLWVLKLGLDGAVEWQKTYGGANMDEADCIQQSRDGGYVVAGYTNSFGAGDLDLWVLKLTSDGTVEWQKTYGGPDIDGAQSIQQTQDGGYVVAGETRTFGDKEFPDLWVSKLRADGTVEWQKTYGGPDIDGAQSIQQTRDGGYIVAGGTRSFSFGGADFWVLKLNSDGIIDWQKTYGGVDDDAAFSIHQTYDNGYVVAGLTKSFSAGRKGTFDVWVLKLTADGTVEWQEAFGGDYDDWVKSIQQTGDNGYVMAGWTQSFGAGACDLLVLKLRSDGSIDSPCDFMRDTSISWGDSSATVKLTNVSGVNSDAKTGASLATIRSIDVSARVLCP